MWPGNKKFIIIVVLIAIFLGVAFFVYKSYVEPRLNAKYVPNDEFIEEEKEADIYLFYVTWCPHCKKALPIWNELKEQMNEQKIGAYKVYFKEVDCEKDEEMAKSFKIEGYPTIKLLKGDEVIELDSNPSKEAILEFLNASLQ